MTHVTIVRSRRHDRARPSAPARQVARSSAITRVADPLPLFTVSAQVVIGFLAPLPFIQLGHWCLGWPSVLVMLGGQG